MATFKEGFADKLQVPVGKFTKPNKKGKGGGKPIRDIQVFDDELPGFGIRKYDNGAAVYFVKYNVGTQQRRKTLGAVVRGNLKAMRLRASEILAQATLGTDVVAVAKAAAKPTTPP